MSEETIETEEPEKKREPKAKKAKKAKKVTRPKYIPDSTLIIRFDGPTEIAEFKRYKKQLAEKLLPDGARASWAAIAKACIRRIAA